MFDAARFWSNVDVRGPDECWPWKLSTTKNGYGQFVCGGVHYYTHRVACEQAHGPAPSDKPYALHAQECTSRACCNGAHLRWGTQQENMSDKLLLGRQQRGAACSYAKLNESEVLAIRRLREDGAPVVQLAEQFGISTRLVYNVINRQRWRHI